MAINVNTVYQTVLLMLNKEQRGFITPDEFNKIGTQVQLEIFEKYFEDLNQQLRVPQSDIDYADRVASLDEKISIFKTFGDTVYDTTYAKPFFKFSSTDAYNREVKVHKLGTVTYEDEYGNIVEVERLPKTEFYNIERSPLTKSTKSFPTYLYESQPNPNVAGQPINNTPTNILYVNPSDITDNVKVDFIRKPQDIKWGFSVGNRGQYIYNSTYYSATTGQGSIDFELHASEQTNVILRVLAYSGVVINDPQIIQAAASQVNTTEVNKKS